jgi:hypothetical protein
MSTRKVIGTQGEEDVVRLVPCPNCKKKLMRLPVDYPLFDLQCTGCSFRAQVKTINSREKDKIWGAGWDIANKVLKSGYMMPPLIVNYVWSEKGIMRRKIIFFPFIPKVNIKKRIIGATSQRANYKMFDYVGLLSLPQFKLYEE